MGRTRDVSKILTSNTSILTLASASATYATIESAGGDLTLLNTTSFSTVGSQSFNDVFSATYTNYKILGFCQSSTTGGTGNIRFRVGGSDDSTNNYNQQELSVQNTSIVGTRSTSSNILAITGFRQSEDNLFETLICNPFATAKTTVISQVFDPLSGVSYYTYSGKFNQTTSFTGFTFFGTNLTGTISIYGMAK